MTRVLLMLLSEMGPGVCYRNDNVLCYKNFLYFFHLELVGLVLAFDRCKEVEELLKSHVVLF